MIYYNDKKKLLNEQINKLNSGDTLFIQDGIYNEKIKITNSNITIIGNGKNTIISNKDYYNKIHIDNKEFLTVRTYTLLVSGDNVKIENLSIRNESVPNSIYGQAVSLEVLGDNFLAKNLNIIGAQDTILSGPLPYDLTIRYKDLLPKDELKISKSHQLYENCYIEGDVDFIFGSGIAYFDKCNLHSIGKGYISAPSHPKEYKYGFVFNECSITSEKNVSNVILARPWRDYGASTFINCTINSHVNPLLFNNWTKDRENTCKFNIYNSTNTDKMVCFAKELSADEAKKYSKKEVLNS